MIQDSNFEHIRFCSIQIAFIQIPWTSQALKKISRDLQVDLLNNLSIRILVIRWRSVLFEYWSYDDDLFYSNIGHTMTICFIRILVTRWLSVLFEYWSHDDDLFYSNIGHTMTICFIRARILDYYYSILLLIGEHQKDIFLLVLKT